MDTLEDSNTLASNSVSWTSSMFSADFGKKLIFLAVLPLTCFLGHVFVSLWAHSALTGKSLLLALTGLLLIAKWGKLGLAMSASLLIVTLAVMMGRLDSKAWHLLHATSLLLNWVVLFLSFEEIRATYTQFEAQLADNKKELNTTLTLLRRHEGEWSEEKRTLEEELEKLKEEAALRTIDYEKQNEHLMLVQSELDLLTAQKEEILRGAQRMREEAEQLYQTMGLKSLELERFEHEKEFLLARLKKAEQIEIEFASLQEGQQTLIQLQSEMARLEEEISQLRLDNQSILPLQEQVQELKLRESEMARLEEEISQLRVDNQSILPLQEQVQELRQLESEMASLEEEISRLRVDNQSILPLQEQVKELNQLKEERVRDQEIIGLLKHNRDQVIVLTEQLKDQSERAKVLEAQLQTAATSSVIDQKAQEELAIYQARCKGLERELEELSRNLLHYKRLEKEVQDLATYQSRCQELEKELSNTLSQYKHFEKEAEELGRERAKTAALKEQLETLAAQKREGQLEELAAQQAKCSELEKELQALQIAHAEAKMDDSPHFQKELARAEGLYNQLRSQFAEKSRVLDKTRQELFQTEGELELLRLDRHNSELDGGDAAEEIHVLAEGLKSLEEEVARLTGEVEELESLVAYLTLTA